MVRLELFPGNYALFVRFTFFNALLASFSVPVVDGNSFGFIEGTARILSDDVLIMFLGKGKKFVTDDLVPFCDGRRVLLAVFDKVSCIVIFSLNSISPIEKGVSKVTDQQAHLFSNCIMLP